MQDHHDDIRQEQKWEMQALSSTSSVDEVASEPNGNEESTDTTATTVNNCGGDDSGLQTNNSNSININNNTIAINNNNCDTIKNNNNQCTTQTTTATTPPAAALKLLNDVEAVPAIALIEHQNPLLRSVNISSLHTTAGTICRKRPLMCNTRNLNNPTKRTVMTLLARAKTANALHGFHPLGPSITE